MHNCIDYLRHQHQIRNSPALTMGLVLNYSIVIFSMAFYVAGKLILHGSLVRRYCGHIKTSLQGKTVIITGGNSGIGRETAIDLARRGARVILACRNEQKAHNALHIIRKQSSSSNVVFRHLDLSDLDSVRSFAGKFLQEEDRLDILINNAGIGQTSKQELTKQGYDLTFGTNHLGHFLLTLLLMDRLNACSPSRIVNVSSMAYQLASRDEIHFNPDDATNDGQVKYPGLVGYTSSKLANILFTRRLAQRLKEKEYNVTTYSLHPGLVSTNIFFNTYERTGYKRKVPYVLMTLLSMVFGVNAEGGAQPSIYCSVEKSITKYSGRYFDNCVPVKESELAQDDGLAKKLWGCQLSNYWCRLLKKELSSPLPHK